MTTRTRPTKTAVETAPAASAQVTIAIPTYNRAELLRGCLASALAQDYPSLHVLVVDNASSDHTAEVVAGLDDERVGYLRNDANVGLYRNWKRAVDANRSPYLCLLQDDDCIASSFVSRSVAALEAHPSAGFAFSLFDQVDEHGARITGAKDAAFIPDGDPIPGLEYLHQIAAGRGWEIHASTVLMRRAALEQVGSLDAPHSSSTHDFNLYLKLAAAFDIACTREVLAQVRIHAAQFTETMFRAEGAAGRLALMSEVTDAIAYLLGSERASDPDYRRWLQERLLTNNRYHSDLAAAMIPELNLSWADRCALVEEEIAASVPDGEALILVDEDQLRFALDLSRRRPIPFLERDGQYFGPPADDEAAVAALERLLRREGARYVAVAWPAFWWLDYFPALRHTLDAGFERTLATSRVVVYRR